jgi:serine/threonine protein kinase
VTDRGIEGLSDVMRARLASGEHERVAAELELAGDPRRAALVLEQIWEFAGAYRAWTLAHDHVAALRAALESGQVGLVDAAVAALMRDGDRERLRAGAALLTAKRRHHDAAAVLAKADDAPRVQADALLRAGDRTAAALVLDGSGDRHGALRALGEPGDGPGSGPAHALAARLRWDLGDAEAAARHAQRALRADPHDEGTRALLCRALSALGHDLAAQIASPQHTATMLGGREAVAIPGRFRVTGVHATGLGGAAYVGFDRTSLREVEIHLLLADLPDLSAAERGVIEALGRFAIVARAAAAIGHPAIRPVLELREAEGLLVLPRAEGPSLRAMIRPPGMMAMRSRARAAIAFLLEGLAAAHERGLVHGWLLPSQIVCDAAGRPLLGPFGAHHLAGLAATHTGSLEEILAVTAPETRSGGAPSVAADVFASGALLAALLTGELGAPVEGTGAEIDLVRAMLDPDPLRRPSAAAAMGLLRAPVAHVRELEAHDSTSDAPAVRPVGADAMHGVVIEAAASWSDADLDALGEASSPWWQPILGRTGRTFVLAPWPEGCRALTGDALAWQPWLPPEALDGASEALHAAIRSRIATSSLVVTPSGDVMIALDDLLAR